MKANKEIEVFWMSACGGQPSLYLSSDSIQREMERIYGYLLLTDYPKLSPSESNGTFFSNPTNFDLKFSF